MTEVNEIDHGILANKEICPQIQLLSDIKRIANRLVRDIPENREELQCICDKVSELQELLGE